MRLSGKERYEREKEYQREYRRKNREKRNAYNRQYKEEKYDEVRAQDHIYRNTEIGRAKNLAYKYLQSDTESGRNTENNVTAEWIVENVFKSKCVYCGDSDWTHLGCDRIDNSRGHTPDNVVCSCGVCNMDKCDRFSVEEFVEYRKTHPRELSNRLKPFVVENKNGVNVLKKVDLDFS